MVSIDMRFKLQKKMDDCLNTVVTAMILDVKLWIFMLIEQKKDVNGLTYWKVSCVICICLTHF